MPWMPVDTDRRNAFFVGGYKKHTAADERLQYSPAPVTRAGFRPGPGRSST
jgi:hypothetical protein